MEIGRQIIHLTNVDSTNNYTANLLKAGEISSGTVILADEQYAGRGQRGAEWAVKPGENLTFSLFLDNVNLSVENQFILTQFISLVLRSLLSSSGIMADIKWPNDIYVRQKKIAGVLIENQLKGKEIKSSIIGIGLNVNQDAFEGFEATSFFKETGVWRKPIDVLYSFCSTFNSYWPLFVQHKYAEIRDEYLSHLLFLNEKAEFNDDTGDFTGTIRGVETNGKLVVERREEIGKYDLKEIRFKL